MARALTIQEFADQFRICRHTAYRLVKSGTVKSIRAGRKLLIPYWAAEEFERGTKQDR